MAVSRCCCFDLRTGTLILLWLQAIGIVGVFQLGNPQQASPQILEGISGICGLYGVYKEKPDFLWPALIINIIGIVGLIILAIFFPLLMAGVASIPNDNIDHHAQGMAVSMLIVVEVIVILGIALEVYFYKVIKAYFNQLNAEIAARTQNVHANNMERGIYPKV